jgi:hypothetical protein
MMTSRTSWSLDKRTSPFCAANFSDLRKTFLSPKGHSTLSLTNSVFSGCPLSSSRLKYENRAIFQISDRQPPFIPHALPSACIKIRKQNKTGG